MVGIADWGPAGRLEPGGASRPISAWVADKQDATLAPGALGPGSVEREVAGKLGEIPSVWDWGGRTGGWPNSDAFNAAANWMRGQNAWGQQGEANAVSVLVPPGRYVVEESINCGSTATGTIGFGFWGFDKLGTIIEARLAEEYPAIDMAGNTRGFLSGISIRGNYADNQANVGILIHKATGSPSGTCGNSVRLANVLVDMGATGAAPNAEAAIVIRNADLTRLHDVEVIGKIGIACGLDLPSALSSMTSKFHTLSSAADNTSYWFSRIISTAGLPLLLTGSAAYDFDQTYLALLGTISSDKACVVLRSSSGSIGNVLRFRGLRTEDQSAAAEAYSFVIDAQCFRALIEGSLSCYGSSTKAHFNFPNARSVSVMDLHFDSSLGTVPLFAGSNATIEQLRQRSNCSALGTVASLTDVDSGWEMPYSEFAAHVSGKGRVDIYKDNNHYAANPSRIILPELANTPLGRGMAQLKITSTLPMLTAAPTTYTAGSGAGTVQTYTIPGGMLNLIADWAIHPILLLKVTFTTLVSSNPTVQFQLRQGATTKDMGTLSGLGASTTVKFEYEIRYNSSGTLAYDGFCHKTGVAPTLVNSTQGSLDLTADIFVDVILTEATINNAITFRTQKAELQ